jgi:hypothetical protein
VFGWPDKGMRQMVFLSERGMLSAPEPAQQYGARREAFGECEKKGERGVCGFRGGASALCEAGQEESLTPMTTFRGPRCADQSALPSSLSLLAP